MTKRKKRFALVFAALTLALTAFIFFNSLQNGEESGKQSDFVVDIVNSFLSFFGIRADVDTLGTVIRKLAHFTEYFVLGITSSLFLLQYNSKRLVAVSPIYCFLIALCDEFIMQMSTEGRAPQFTDVLIDLSGALLALIALLVIIRIKNKEKRI